MKIQLKTCEISSEFAFYSEFSLKWLVTDILFKFIVNKVFEILRILRFLAENLSEFRDFAKIKMHLLAEFFVN